MPRPILKITGLEKSFGALKATNGVTLDLYPREIHALIGPNGAGKSTLVNLISGLLPADAGRIVLDGEVHVIGGEQAAEALDQALGREQAHRTLSRPPRRSSSAATPCGAWNTTSSRSSPSGQCQ